MIQAAFQEMSSILECNIARLGVAGQEICPPGLDWMYTAPRNRVSRRRLGLPCQPTASMAEQTSLRLPETILRRQS
jgi:hypothetical protein